MRQQLSPWRVTRHLTDTMRTDLTKEVKEYITLHPVREDKRYTFAYFIVLISYVIITLPCVFLFVNINWPK